MKITSFSILPLLALLSACGTPQEQCIAASTHDLHVVAQLIRQTQTNISRGYAMQSVTKTMPAYVDCTPHPTDANPNPETQMCWVDQAQTVQQPVAIDLKAEQQKLDGLIAKRGQLIQQSTSAVALCKQEYPE